MKADSARRYKCDYIPAPADTNYCTRRPWKRQKKSENFTGSGLCRTRSQSPDY